MDDVAFKGIKVPVGNVANGLSAVGETVGTYLEKVKNSDLAEWAHNGLGAGSFVPGPAGSLASGIDAVVHLAQGHKFEALTAGGAAVVGVFGDAGLARLAAKGLAPLAGGGAKLENLTAGEIARIQNAANRTGTEISVVGSRAGGTAGATSDWDFVVSESTRGSTVHSLQSSLPEGPRGLGEPRNQDIFRGLVDAAKPYITFTPLK